MNMIKSCVLQWILFGSFMLNGFAQQAKLVLPVGHKSLVVSVAYSPNGKYILTGSLDGTAKLWDYAGREIQTFEGYFGVSLAFSPDGNSILMPSSDQTAKLWSLRGELIQVFKGHTDQISSAVFSPDGKYILTGSIDNTAKLWDLQGNELHTLAGHKNNVLAIAFSPDQQYMATVSGASIVRLWDMEGNKIREIKGHSRMIQSIAFSPDNQYFLTGSVDETAKLWDLQGREILTLEGHNDDVNSVAFSPDGAFMLTGSSDSTLKLWDMEGNELQTIRGHQDQVFGSAVSSDGKNILSGSADRTAKLWNLQGKEIQSFQGRSDYITSVTFSADGRYILIGSFNGTAKLWNVEQDHIQNFEVNEPLQAYFVQNNQAIFTLSQSRMHGGKLWDFNGNLKQTIDIQTKDLKCVAISPDGESILLGYNDGTVVLREVTGRIIRTFEWGSGQVSALRFSPDGKHILAAMSGAGKLWDLQGNEIQTFKTAGYPRSITSVAFSPDGKYVLTGEGSGDYLIRMWDIKGKEIQTFKGHQDDINSLAFSPDGTSIVSGSSENALKQWKLDGQEIQSLGDGSEGFINFMSIGFSPDGKKLITGSLSSTIKLYDLQSGEKLLTLVPFNTDDWLKVSPENFYMSSKSGAKQIQFTAGTTAFSFDQFDLRFNRPDKILESLSSIRLDTALIRHYRLAYQKRLQKHGFTEEMLSDDYHVPTCVIENQLDLPISTSESGLDLQILATDSRRLLDRLNVFVNDVPIYGIQGINLRDQQSQEYRKTLRIPLSSGDNKIQVSALNQGGAESVKATTYITYDAPARKPDLYLATIGVSDYQAEGKDLTYAAKDAKDIAQLYQSKPAFKQIHTKTLTNDQVSKSSILALRSWLETTKVDDQVILFVSGHGMLDKKYDFFYGTHDIDFGNPAERGIKYEEIEGLLDGIPARKKLLLMDACHSGEFDKDADMPTQSELDSLKQRGVSFSAIPKSPTDQPRILGRQNTFETMQRLFTDLRRGSGATVISSSSGAQFSYERDKWANGAFTYVLLHGLSSMAADTDKNGEVSAGELLAYMRIFVPRLTQNQQQPTFRQENLEFDFRVW